MALSALENRTVQSQPDYLPTEPGLTSPILCVSKYKGAFKARISTFLRIPNVAQWGLNSNLGRGMLHSMGPGKTETDGEYFNSRHPGAASG